jgi:uncharacterized protein (DUF305 family)
MRFHTLTLVRRPGRLLGALTLGLALTLTACGSDEPTDTSAASPSDGTNQQTDHNDTDVQFASDMIQHHTQALDMVRLAETRTLDPQVEKLADDIRAAQAPEIETMTGWLEDWDEKVPDSMSGHDMGDMESDSMDGMDSSDGSGSEMPGMMSSAEMAALASASDGDFQDMWLQMMIEHHEGAVEMAETEQADGEYAPAIELAGNIIKSQTAEIDEMKSLLGS